MGSVLSMGQDRRWREAMVAGARCRARHAGARCGRRDRVDHPAARRYEAPTWSRSTRATRCSGRRWQGAPRGSGPPPRRCHSPMSHSTGSPSATCCGTSPMSPLPWLELARVLRPGGRMGMVEFGRPDWDLGTAVVAVHPCRAARGGEPSSVVVGGRWGVSLGRASTASPRSGHRSSRRGVAPSRAHRRDGGETVARWRACSCGHGDEVVDPALPRPDDGRAPAWYAQRGGRAADLVTLLHIPYTAWHLGYVAMGAALAPVIDWRVLAGTLLAFAIGLGVSAHALDELHGRPLRHRVERRSAARARRRRFRSWLAALAVAGAMLVSPWILVWAAAGILISAAYSLEWIPALHTLVGFGLAWGAFPVLAGYWAQTRSFSAACAWWSPLPAR